VVKDGPHGRGPSRVPASLWLVTELTKLTDKRRGVSASARPRVRLPPESRAAMRPPRTLVYGCSKYTRNLPLRATFRPAERGFHGPTLLSQDAVALTDQILIVRGGVIPDTEWHEDPGDLA
jgi:hypothetical protein